MTTAWGGTCINEAYTYDPTKWRITFLIAPDVFGNILNECSNFRLGTKHRRKQIVLIMKFSI